MEVELARTRKSDANRKSDRTKALLGMSRPSTLAEIAASRGMSEATLYADILSSFEAHGESPESKLGKEFRAWLMRFALALYDDDIRPQAWDELKSKCNVLILLKELYLFTHSGKTSADVIQNACGFLKEKLDKLLSNYKKLQKKHLHSSITPSCRSLR
jgi:hypothetical protein